MRDVNYGEFRSAMHASPPQWGRAARFIPDREHPMFELMFAQWTRGCDLEILAGSVWYSVRGQRVQDVFEALVSSEGYGVHVEGVCLGLFPDARRSRRCAILAETVAVNLKHGYQLTGDLAEPNTWDTLVDAMMRVRPRDAVDIAGRWGQAVRRGRDQRQGDGWPSTRRMLDVVFRWLVQYALDNTGLKANDLRVEWVRMWEWMRQEATALAKAQPETHGHILEDVYRVTHYTEFKRELDDKANAGDWAKIGVRMSMDHYAVCRILAKRELELIWKQNEWSPGGVNA